MGNTNSFNPHQTDKYIVYEQNKNTILLQEKVTGKQLCLKEFVLQNEKQFNDLKIFLETKLEKNHRHLTKLLEIVTDTSFHMCSNLYRLKVLFEHPFKTLKNEIDERRIGGKEFKENQILSILYSCLMGLKQLNNLGLSHNCIKPQRIFIADDGFIKLSQPKLLDQLSNLDLLRTSKLDNLIVSPQQIQCFLQNKIYNLNKSDIFCLGIILLQLSLLISPDELYQSHYQQLNSSQLIQIQQSIRTKYSNKLYKIIKSMTELNPQKRGSVQDILQIIKQKTVVQNIENNENLESNFYRTMKLSKLMKSSEILPVSNPPNIEKARKQQKQNKFPLPSFATLWVNKQAQNIQSIKNISEPIKQQSNKLEKSVPRLPLQDVLPVRTKIIKIDPTKLSRQSNKIISEKQTKHSSKPTAISTLNRTISEVTEPQNSMLEPVTTVYQQYEEGSYYQGQKWGALKHGHGKFYYKDGGYYDGQWKQDRMNGKGTLYYQEGRIAYDGQWKDDQFNGYGKVFNDQPNYNLSQHFSSLDFSQLDDFWLYYQGYFVRDTKHGRGKVMLTNGQVFEGTFIKDAVDGFGKFKTIKGQIIEGLWKQNKFVKKQ